MAYDFSAGLKEELSYATSPVPLWGNFGCVKFKDGRKVTSDFSYLPVETEQEARNLLISMDASPIFSDVSLLRRPL